MTINTGTLLVRDGAEVSASTPGKGNSGNLTVNAFDSVQVIGTSANGQHSSLLSVSAGSSSSGNGGDLTINTGTLLVRDGAQVSASTFGTGNSGNLTVNASNSVQLIGTSTDGHTSSGLFVDAEPGSSGNGGDLTINTGTLLVQSGSEVDASTFGKGNSGNLMVNASNSVQVIGTSAGGQAFSGLFTSAESGSNGNGGDLTINTGTLLVRDGAQVSASTFGTGNSGNLTVNASNSVQLIGTSADGQTISGLFASTERGSSGNGGDLTIHTGTLLVRDGAQVFTGTFGKGNSGNLTVNAFDSVQLIGTSADGHTSSGLAASAERGSSGNGGDLIINTGTLLVRDGAEVSANTLGTGNSGNLTVNASNSVQLIGTSADSRFPSALAASTESGSSGNGGDLTINTGTLLVQDGAQVSASTSGTGNSGNLTVNAFDSVQLIGTSTDGHTSSGLFVDAEPGSSGKAGDLMINTGTLLVLDGAQVSTATFGNGNGGNLTVNASGWVKLIGTNLTKSNISSSLLASAERGSSGNGGNLRINTGTLLVRDGAQVSAGTLGTGNSGNLTVNASNFVQLIGTSADDQYPSGLFASAEPDSSGKAGDLTVNTPSLLVGDGARVSVRNPTGQAGNLTIQANSVHLNRGSLLAQTALSGSEGGANITLKSLDLLRLDNESLISANAFGQATGGNITIDSTFVVATPPTGSNGSDITANAGQGNGGAVNITTQGLFGIQFRPRLTPKNDITVSSDFGLNGTFQLNTPGVDPSRGLSNLPTQVLDASRQVGSNCVARVSGQENSFTITGTSGLPPRPGDPIDSPFPTGSVRAIPGREGRLGRPRGQGDNHTDISQQTSPSPASPTPAPLVEATGWVYGPHGEVVLTAQANTATSHSSWSTPPTCQGQ